LRNSDSELDGFKLHVYDNFIWRDFMDERAPLGLRSGASFRSRFEENVRDYADLIVAHEEALPDEPIPGDRLANEIGDFDPPNLLSWDDGPIEILFEDGAKSWKAMRHLLSETGPSLTPGSLVVCQDYKYWGTYWVALALEMIDSLELVHVLGDNTVTFRVTEPLNVRLPILTDLDVEEGLAALEAAGARLRAHGDSYGAIIIQVAKVRFLGAKGDGERAARTLRAVERRWPGGVRPLNLERAREWLEESTGRAYPPSPLYRARRVPRKVRGTLLAALSPSGGQVRDRPRP